jgi:hypothetical protein
VRAALAGLAVVAGASSSPAEETLPSAVREALGRYAQAFDPMTLTWTCQPSGPSPEAFFAYTGFPPDPQTFMKFSARHTWQGGKGYAFLTRRHKKEADPVNGQDRSEYTQEMSFDGTYYYYGQGLEVARRQGVPAAMSKESMTNRLKKVPGKTMLLEAALYYQELGLKLPITVREFATEAKQESLVLWLLRQGAELTSVREEALAGRPALRVELKGTARLADNSAHDWQHVSPKDCTYRFFLDPQRGHALLRREEWTAGGQLAVLSEAEDFEQLGKAEVWLPRKVTVQLYMYLQNKKGPRKEPLLTNTYSLVKHDTAPAPDERFAINYDHVPGSFVTTDVLPDKRVLDEPISYQVPATPDQLNEVIGAALAGRKYQPASRWLFRSKFVLINVAVVAVAGGLYWWWARRRVRTEGGQS